MNKKFVIISPNFPETYYKFAKALKERGIDVIGLGDAFNHELRKELSENLIEYVHVDSLTNVHDKINAIAYLKSKYGHIDYIESNNEFWLENDSILREWFQVNSGIYHSEINKYKAKSEMKKYFIDAGAKVAKYCLSDNYGKVLEFVNEVGYPIFVKPNVGVGASGARKIKNIEDLQHFYQTKDNNQYIFEQYIDGTIHSYDGIVNSKGEIILEVAHKFLEKNDEIMIDSTDDAYFTYKDIPEDIKDLGRRIIKSFDLKSRCFHIELFRLNVDLEGYGKKGDLVALEVNMRPAGGYTPELISLRTNASFYEIYADMIAYDENRQDMSKEKYFAISVSRRDRYSYVLKEHELLEKYKDVIVKYGRYADAIKDIMGDSYYMAKFENLEDLVDFENKLRAKFF